MKKIDSTGKYLPFRGVSFVCMTYSSEKDRFDKLFEFLSTQKTLAKYYSFLPVSSYHFTVKNHQTISDRSEWIDYNLRNFQSLNAFLCKSFFLCYFFITGLFYILHLNIVHLSYFTLFL